MIKWSCQKCKCDKFDLCKALFYLYSHQKENTNDLEQLPYAAASLDPTLTELYSLAYTTNTRTDDNSIKGMLQSAYKYKQYELQDVPVENQSD